jgi:hypothetical protein
MKEKEAYEVLGWPNTAKGNDGDEWLPFRCPTPGCQSEGVSRSREFGFGRCGRCSAILEVVKPADAQSRVNKDEERERPSTSTTTKSGEKANVSKELASAEKLGEQLEELVVKRGQCPDEDRNILLMAYWALIFDFHKAILGLIPRQLCGSAFPLVRPCLETLVRAHVTVKGSAADVKNLQDDTYHTDFDKIGQWMDTEFATERLFTNFIGGAPGPNRPGPFKKGLSQVVLDVAAEAAALTLPSSFIRSLTWIFSTERTASLISRLSASSARPATSLSNFSTESSHVKGREARPG